MVVSLENARALLQTIALSRYAKRKFPREKKEVSDEKLDASLTNIVSSIDDLRRQKREGEISDAEFADKLLVQKDKLEVTLAEADTDIDPEEIVRQRTTGFFSSMTNIPGFKDNEKDPAKEG